MKKNNIKLFLFFILIISYFSCITKIYPQTHTNQNFTRYIIVAAPEFKTIINGNEYTQNLISNLEETSTPLELVFVTHANQYGLQLGKQYYTYDNFIEDIIIPLAKNKDIIIYLKACYSGNLIGTIIENSKLKQLLEKQTHNITIITSTSAFSSDFPELSLITMGDLYEHDILLDIKDSSSSSLYQMELDWHGPRMIQKYTNKPTFYFNPSQDSRNFNNFKLNNIKDIIDKWSYGNYFSIISTMLDFYFNSYITETKKEQKDQLLTKLFYTIYKISNNQIPSFTLKKKVINILTTLFNDNLITSTDIVNIIKNTNMEINATTKENSFFQINTIASILFYTGFKKEKFTNSFIKIQEDIFTAIKNNSIIFKLFVIDPISGEKVELPIEQQSGPFFEQVWSYLYPKNLNNIENIELLIEYLNHIQNSLKNNYLSDMLNIFSLFIQQNVNTLIYYNHEKTKFESYFSLPLLINYLINENSNINIETITQYIKKLYSFYIYPGSKDNSKQEAFILYTDLLSSFKDISYILKLAFDKIHISQYKNYQIDIFHTILDTMKLQNVWDNKNENLFSSLFKQLAFVICY